MCSCISNMGVRASVRAPTICTQHGHFVTLNFQSGDNVSPGLPTWKPEPPWAVCSEGLRSCQLIACNTLPINCLESTNNADSLLPQLHPGRWPISYHITQVSFSPGKPVNFTALCEMTHTISSEVWTLSKFVLEAPSLNLRVVPYKLSCI